MKKLKMLEIIEGLAGSSETKFIPVDEANMIYVDFGCSQSDLSKAYNASKKISKLFDAKVIFHFNGYDMMVDKNTTMTDVQNQYIKEHQVDYSLYVEEIFAKSIKNLSIKNAKRKTRKPLHLIRNEGGFKEYISDYQMNNLSHALRSVYKSTLPDLYLKSMVEKAKVMQKTNH